ncbi:MAG TPA: DNA topoisomerase 3 [Bacillota bacterium]|nr:DNA topoisomerase 3 [Bacillota bacterium]
MAASPPRRRTPRKTRNATDPEKAVEFPFAANLDPGQKVLVVAEKPSVARDLARSLGGFASGQGVLSRDPVLITWAIGHLVELAEPEDYRSTWRRWALAGLPILPETFRLRPVNRTRAHLERVVELLARRDVALVVNACDAGREGELIFRYLYELAGCRLPVMRLWISSLTGEAIRQGFGSLRPAGEFDSLAAAARCRSESDWLVGINATRGMTGVSGTLLPVGRVQTPTLALLVERERAVAAFVPRPFWQVEAVFAAAGETYRGRWVHEDDDRLWSEEAAREIARRVQGGAGEVEGVEHARRTQPPYLLPDLTDLQRELNRTRGFSAAKTLKLAQELYERDKLITYPRTGSRHLPPDLIPSLGRVLAAIAASEGLPGAREAAALAASPRLPLSGRIIDDRKVKDHHAIIPTPKRAPLEELRGDKGVVYQAIVRRFVAVFLPACVTETTRILTRAGGDRFRSEAQVLLEAGWRVLYPEPAPDQPLPDLKPGTPVAVTSVTVEESATRPPARYTEASLLRAMETAGSLVSDDELAEVMREEGIGTPATRAAIIERLLEVDYVSRQGRALVPTPKGMALIDRLPVRELTSVALTGQWERRLRQIEEGSCDRERFMEDVRRFTAEAVEQIRSLPAIPSAGFLSGGIGGCRRCGSPVVEGPRGFRCSRSQDPSCVFQVPRLIAGRKLTAGQAADLLARGRTGLLRGFRARTGRRFAAYLVLDSEGRVTFQFPARRARWSD